MQTTHTTLLTRYIYPTVHNDFRSLQSCSPEGPGGRGRFIVPGGKRKTCQTPGRRHTLFGTYVSGRIIFAAGDTLICGTQGPEVCMNAVCPSDLETGNGVPQNRTSTCGFWWTAYSFQGVMVRFNAVPLLAPLSFVADWAQNTIQLINIFPCLAIQSPQTQTVQVKMTSAVHLNLPNLVFLKIGK